MISFKELMESASLHALPVRNNRPFKKGDKVVLMTPWSGRGPFYLFATVITSSSRGVKIQSDREPNYEHWKRVLYNQKTGVETDQIGRSGYSYIIHADNVTTDYIETRLNAHAKKITDERIREWNKQINWGQDTAGGQRLGMTKSSMKDQVDLEEKHRDQKAVNFYDLSKHNR